MSISPQGLTRVQQATEADGEMVLLKMVIQTGWPDTKEEVPLSVQGYFHFRDELSVQDGLVLKGERLVVPKSMRGNEAETAPESPWYPGLFEERKRSGLLAWNK